MGGLVIEGEGPMDDYASAAEVPWASSLPGVTAVRVVETVRLGANSLAGVRPTASANGMVLADLFAAVGGQDPAGAVSGGEFEIVEIVDGELRLGVSVCTNSELEVEKSGGDWNQAKIKAAQVEDDGTVTLTVPAPADKGFMILRSKDATAK